MTCFRQGTNTALQNLIYNSQKAHTNQPAPSRLHSQG